MKSNSFQKPVLYTLAGCGLAYAGLQAIERNESTNSPQIQVDTTPMNRESSMAVSFAETIKKITPSVVKVEVISKGSTLSETHLLDPGFGNSPFGLSPQDLQRFFGQQGEAPRQQGAGSGVIISTDGYILTNNHVIDRADEVQITLSNGVKHLAKVIGQDPKTDLAVLKVEASSLQAITFSDSDQAQIGDIVLAMGNSFGIGQSATMGMISATGRATLGLDYEDFIQTDAAINPGNSGGALVDTQGRLIGINTAILSRGGGNNGVGFAIPANMARHVMEQLIRNGEVVRAFLGVQIQDLSPALARQLGAAEDIQGALVSDVPLNTPAHQAGIQSGDIITSVDQQPIKDARALKLAIGKIQPEVKIKVGLLRDGKAQEIEVQLTPQSPPTIAKNSNESSKTTSQQHLQGVRVTDLNSPHAARRGFRAPQGIEGVLVISVDSQSAAWQAGIRPGDVIQQINRQPVRNVNDAINLTRNSNQHETLLKIWNENGSRFVSVDERKNS